MFSMWIPCLQKWPTWHAARLMCLNSEGPLSGLVSYRFFWRVRSPSLILLMSNVVKILYKIPSETQCKLYWLNTSFFFNRQYPSVTSSFIIYVCYADCFTLTWPSKDSVTYGEHTRKGKVSKLEPEAWSISRIGSHRHTFRNAT